MIIKRDEKLESPLARARRLAVHALATLDEARTLLWGLEEIYMAPEEAPPEDADTIRAEYAWVDQAGAWGDILKRLAKTIEADGTEKALGGLYDTVAKMIRHQLDAEEADREARNARRRKGNG
ncbi:MAG: hypothetical protein IKO01_11275 [Kiritimatiellae bacterium]|nr:hypothetical protein [Kiritimatiellia bacterium]